MRPRNVRPIRSFCAATTLAACALLSMACNDDAPDSACTSGDTRTFECQADPLGTQPQTCVDGVWYSTSFCADGDGNPIDSDWEDETCTNGETRAAVCGPNDQGLQPQRCEDGAWVSTNDCNLGPDGEGFDPGGNNGGDGGNNGNDGEVTLPSDPSTCPVLSPNDINGGQTLAENSCYRIEGNLTLNDGTLTIQPGVTLIAEQAANLRVENDGRLQVQGSASNPVGFLGKIEESGYWGGLRIDNTASGTHNIEHAVFRHAGADEYAIYLTSSSGDVRVENTRFEAIDGAGLIVDGDSGLSSLKNNHFTDSKISLVIPVNLIPLIDDNLTIENNELDYIQIDSATGSYITTGLDATWPNIGVPLRFNARRVVVQGPHIQVEAGTILEFAQVEDHELRIDNGGTFETLGTQDDPVILRSPNDGRGAWGGVKIYDTGNAILDHTHILGGGGSGLHLFAAISVDNDAKLTISNTHIAHAKEYGISVRPNGEVYGCDNITFEDIPSDEWVNATNQDTIDPSDVCN